MKFTIATIHCAYGLSYVPDGKIVESELSNAKAPVSLVNINWLKPAENHKYIADMMLQAEIIGLERVEKALLAYFKEQFLDNDSRLLWMPSFHRMHLFCKHYLEGKSVFDVGNTIFSKVLNEIATEVEVLVFYLGEKSLTELGSPNLSTENFTANAMKIQVSPYEVSDKPSLFDALLKNYSLTMLNREKDSIFNTAFISDPVLLEQFSNYGKLEVI